VFVVVQSRRDEQPVRFRLIDRLVDALGNAPALFDERMAGAARITRGPHPQGQVEPLETPEAGKQVGVLRLLELRQLVEADELEFGALVAELVAG
jgi:hypothetical protein